MEITGLNNRKSSQTLHMSVWRSHDSIPEDGNCKKPETSDLFMGNLPFDKHVHVDEF